MAFWRRTWHMRVAPASEVLLAKVLNGAGMGTLGGLLHALDTVLQTECNGGQSAPGCNHHVC